jgi:hypothetical protein
MLLSLAVDHEGLEQLAAVVPNITYEVLQILSIEGREIA